MNKFLAKQQLHTGSVELSRLQRLYDLNLLNYYDLFVKQYGLILSIDWDGITPDDWKPTKADLYNVAIAPGKAIVQDVNGETAVIGITTPVTMQVPAVDGTYKVLVKHTYTPIEKGTVTLTNNSAVVPGVGTEFTKQFAANRRLIVDNVMYAVLQIDSDTQLLLSAPYVGVTKTRNYAVGGYFANAPVSVSENYIYEHDAVEFKITSDAVGQYEYWIAEIQVVGGVLQTVTDKRLNNRFVIDLMTPLFDSSFTRTRSRTIYKTQSVCANTVNATITALTPQITANDSHPTDFVSKISVRFKKTADDEILRLSFTPLYTDTGLPLSADDQIKYQGRLDVDGQAEGTPVLFSATEATYNISGLSAGYYTATFKMKKVTTANFNLSVWVNEIVVEGNKEIVIGD